MRRGLTLVEVVVATALLAVVVAATLPFFQSASGAFDSPGAASRDMALLAVFAERLPESHEWKSRGESNEISIEWPSDLAERAVASNFRGAPVRVRFPSSTTANDDSGALAPPEAASATTVDGEWIEITCGGIAINRWVARPRSPRGQRSPRFVRRRPSRPRTLGDLRATGTPNRAFTLVETVIALALVSALSVAAVSWSVTAARLARVSSDRANQDDAARAVLRLIDDDIHTFDRIPDGRGATPASRARRTSGTGTRDGTDGQPSRVRIESGALLIETRARVGLHASATGEITPAQPTGKATHRYALDTRKAELSLLADGHTPRVLIRGATAFDCMLDEENRTLDVSITLEGGTVFTRSYIAP